jgi:hypothetical protein
MCFTPSRNSDFHFIWEAQDRATGVILPIRVEVFIDPMNGKLTELDASVDSYQLRDRWKLTEKQALGVARGVRGIPTGAKACVRRRTLRVWQGKHVDQWVIEFLTTTNRRTGRQIGPEVMVDDDTGLVCGVSNVGH